MTDDGLFIASVLEPLESDSVNYGRGKIDNGILYLFGLVPFTFFHGPLF